MLLYNFKKMKYLYPEYVDLFTILQTLWHNNILRNSTGMEHTPADAQIQHTKAHTYDVGI